MILLFLPTGFDLYISGLLWYKTMNYVMFAISEAAHDLSL